MLSRKRSGNCAGHQRDAARALKRARFLSLMPYIS
jgi:small subunit ribosomal protein S18